MDTEFETSTVRRDERRARLRERRGARVVRRVLAHRHHPALDSEHTEPSTPRASRVGRYAPAFVKVARCGSCGRRIALVPEATNRQAYWRAA